MNTYNILINRPLKPSRCLISERMSETVNGKVDMGTRRLVTSHVENAASFYAYLESDQDFMTEIKKSVMSECKSVSKLNTPPKIDQVSLSQIGSTSIIWVEAYSIVFFFYRF